MGVVDRLMVAATDDDAAADPVIRVSVWSVVGMVAVAIAAAARCPRKSGLRAPVQQQ
jgi:hypothetical protein